ncbi:MAG: ABC transporter permease [Acidimicrobiales bacterium]
MTAITVPSPTTVPSERNTAIADALTVAWRNVKGMTRNPQVIVFSTIQPIIFVLNFRYVFGGAIGGSLPPGIEFVDFLMPGIFVQTVTFGATGAAVGMASDLGSGILERFRSLPMARSAVLAGRSLADLVRNTFVIALMMIVGFIVGFEVHTNALSLLAVFGLLLAFMFSLTWVFAAVGLMVKDPEAAQAASFPVMAVLVFASNAFVPTETMPGWLRAYADHQPVSDVVSACRSLVLGGPTTGNVLIALAWCVGIVAVFAPVAIRKYRQAG